MLGVRLGGSAQIPSRHDQQGRRLTCAVLCVWTQRHRELVKAIFELYKAKDRAPRMALRHWLAFLAALKLSGPRMGEPAPTCPHPAPGCLLTCSSSD